MKVLVTSTALTLALVCSSSPLFAQSHSGPGAPGTEMGGTMRRDSTSTASGSTTGGISAGSAAAHMGGHGAAAHTDEGDRGSLGELSADEGPLSGDEEELEDSRRGDKSPSRDLTVKTNPSSGMTNWGGNSGSTGSTATDSTGGMNR